MNPVSVPPPLSLLTLFATFLSSLRNLSSRSLSHPVLSLFSIIALPPPPPSPLLSLLHLSHQEVTGLFLCGLQSLFQTGNVIQLISRSSGKALEILSGPNGQLIVDGNGPVDPNAFHSQYPPWVVSCGLRYACVCVL